MFRFYLDECMQARALRDRLVTDGNEVVTSNEAGLNDKDDDVVFRYAADNDFAIITANVDHFRDLHVRYQRDGLHHAGIVLVHRGGGAPPFPPSQIADAVANMRVINSSWTAADLRDRVIHLSDYRAY